MNEGIAAKNRLRSVLLRDKIQMSDGYMKAMRNDIARVLSYYMCLSEDGVNAQIDIDENGCYVVKIQAVAQIIKQIKTV